MSFVFGGAKPTQQDQIKRYSREIQRHIRALERDSTQGAAKEKQTEREIRKYADKNDIAMAKLKARQLVQERMFRKRLQVTQQGLHSIAQQLTILHSSQHSQDVLAKTTRILAALNSKMNIGATYKMIQEFERQSTTMEEKQELVHESLDNMFEVDDADIDQTMSAVFEELGLELRGNAIFSASNAKTSLADPEHGADLAERLERLKLRR